MKYKLPYLRQYLTDKGYSLTEFIAHAKSVVGDSGPGDRTWSDATSPNSAGVGEVSVNRIAQISKAAFSDLKWDHPRNVLEKQIVDAQGRADD